MKRMKLLFTLAIPVLLCQNAQAQTSSRLIGEAHWTNNGAAFVPADSTSLTYSNGRGGDLKHQLKFDNSTMWIYTDSAYANQNNYIQTFDANNNLLTSITQYWDGATWINSTNILYFYTGTVLNNIVTQSWGGSNWVNVSEDVYTYTPSNQLFTDEYETWNGATFTPVSEKTYYYDGSNNKTLELDEVYSSSLGAFVYSTKYAYTYSGTNQQLTNTYSIWNDITWVPNYMYTNTYDSTGNETNQEYQTYNTTTATWTNVSLKNFSNFNSAKLPMTEIDQTWNASSGTGVWDNVREYAYTYNSFNQMTSSVGESWNIAGFWEYANGDPKANYYYETYSPTSSNTSVKTVGNNSAVNLYPVPAANMLHIDLNWANAQSATIAIYDMQGRMISESQTPVVTQYSTSVSVSNLADGMYVVRINGTQGQIVKQIVVAH